jgi:S1-C subfamily serine protease
VIRFALQALICAQLIGASSFSAPAQQALPDLIDGVKWSVVRIELQVDKPTNPKPGEEIPADIQQMLDGSGSLVEGTGLVFNGDADILTAAHVASAIQDTQKALWQRGIASQLYVGFVEPNINSTSFQVRDDVLSSGANIILIDASRDLAILHSQINPVADQFGTINRSGSERFVTVVKTKPLKFASSAARDGESVFACGYPANSFNLITTSGNIASASAFETLMSATVAGIPTPQDVYKVDLKINFGNSGGPIFRSSDSAVLGIVIETGGGPGGLAIAIPSRMLTEFLTAHHIPWVSAGK